MHTGDGLLTQLIKEPIQVLQRARPRATDTIAVGNEDRVVRGQRKLRSRRGKPLPVLLNRRTMPLNDLHHLFGKPLPTGVNRLNQLLYNSVHTRRICQSGVFPQFSSNKKDTGMELVIFHYHLLPGGVTGVIEQTIDALDRFSDMVDRITVVSGSSERVEEWKHRDRVTVLPEIGYVSRSRLAEAAPPSPPTGPDVVSPTEHGSKGDEPSDDSLSGPIGQVSPEQVADGCDVLAREGSKRRCSSGGAGSSASGGFTIIIWGRIRP